MSNDTKTMKNMDELAKLANVSVSTVSRALAGSTLISTKTRERIAKLAEEHNFQLNEKARNFRLKKTNMIAVVMMVDIKSGQHISDMFFLQMLGSLADALTAQGYDLLLTHIAIEDMPAIDRSRAFRQTDGIIFIGQGNQQEHLNRLSDLGKPMVVWGAELENSHYCTVGTNNELGGYLATKHLLNLGRERIAFFGDINFPEPQQRYSGYCRALQEKGLPIDKSLQHNVPFDMTHANTEIHDLMQQGLKFDAAVCSSDLIAIAAIDAFNSFGVKVPDDIALVGFDDIALAALTQPPLTTVKQNITQGGHVIVRKLLAQINGDPASDTILKTELVVRRSSGAW